MKNQQCEFLKMFSDSNVFLSSRIKKIIQEISFDDFNLHSTLRMSQVKESEPFGELSLYEGLRRAKEVFEIQPLYFNKEIYIILGSYNSVDSQPIYELVQWFVKQKI